MGKKRRKKKSGMIGLLIKIIFYIYIKIPLYILYLFAKDIFFIMSTVAVILAEAIKEFQLQSRSSKYNRPVGFSSDYPKNKPYLSNRSAYGYESLPKLSSPAGYIYIIQDIDISKQYKIGRTNHPRARMNRFGVELPFKTKVIHVLQTDNAILAEKQLHKKYAQFRTNGEWFELSQTQLDEIRAMG